MLPPPAPDPPRPPSEEPDDALVKALEEYHRRRGAGLPVKAEDFRAQLGERYQDLCDILEAETVLDAAKAAPPSRAQALGPFGSYTLVRQIGRGGVGTVFEAVDRRLGRVVALKRLHDSHDAEALSRERFLNEARLTAQVRHDHVVTIHDVGDVDGQLYYTMDLVPGESLDKLIAAGKAPDPRVLARELAHVVDALAALHAHQIVHRDIKPHNIIVRLDGRMILADFGLARVLGGMRFTKTGHVSATGHYASPEQLRAKHDEIDARSDVYNVGSTLYAALVGQPPFPTEDWNELYRQKLLGRAPLPSAQRPGIDPDLEAIVVKCLEPLAQDRYQSAAELAAQLRRYAEGLPVTLGGPVGRLRRGLRGLRRRWIPLTAAAAALAGAAYWWTHRPARLVFHDLGLPIAGAISINGADQGMTPGEVEVAAGEHRIVVARPGFKDWETTQRVAAGDERFLTPLEPPLVLVPEPRDDEVAAGDLVEGLRRQEQRQAREAARKALAAVVRRLGGISEDEFRTRSGEGRRLPLAIVAPGGAVRAQDLRLGWVANVDWELFERGGALLLLRGDEELWRETFSPPGDAREQLFCGLFPASVLERIAPGDRLEIVWQPPAGFALEAVRARVEVRGDDPAREALARVEPWLGDPAGALAAQLRAEVLLHKGLLTAAWFEAVRAHGLEPEQREAARVLVRVLDAAAPDAPLLPGLDGYVLHGGPMPALCAPPR